MDKSGISLNGFESKRYYSPSKRVKKEDFLKEFKDLIIEWTKRNERLIVESRGKYSWKGMGSEKRDELEREINRSRQRHQGGIDLRILDKIYYGDFQRNFVSEMGRKL